ncbi:hypothetical protein PENTCL1PPCAC_23737, partial [Pristionchus entomophagus]
DLESENPDDCLLSIFARLDHNDLDQLSTVSRKMMRLSDISRTKCKLFEASKLLVSQKNHETNFSVDYGSRWFTLNTTVSTIFKMTSIELGSSLRLESPSIYPDTLPISVENINLVSPLLTRFNFDIMTFSSIRMDDNFFEFFKHITSTRTVRMIEFIHCNFDENLSRNDRERYAIKSL